MRLADFYPLVPSPSMHVVVESRAEARALASACRAVARDASQYWAGRLSFIARLLDGGRLEVRLDEGDQPLVARAMQLAQERALELERIDIEARARAAALEESGYICPDY